MNYIKKHIENKKNITIVLIFWILSLFMIIPFRNTPLIYWDLPYHLAPINEILSNIHSDNFIIPSIATKTMGSFGYPANIFYPVYSCIPLVFLRLFFSAYHAYLVFLVIISFLSFLSIYYISKKLKLTTYGALISSLIYGFSEYRLSDMFGRQDLSQCIAYILIPFAFYGFYQITIKNYKHWWILSISMTLLLLTHLLSTILISIFFIISLGFLLISKNNILIRVKYLVIATITTILLSSFFIIPLIQAYISTNGVLINISEMSNTVVDINNMIGFYSIGILQLLVIIVSLLSLKILPTFYKYLLVESIIFLYLASSLFPWNTSIFQNLFSVLQFPIRFLLIFSLLTSIIGGFIFEKMISSKNTKIIILVLITIFECLVFLNYTNIAKTNVGAEKSSYRSFVLETNNIKNYDYLPKSAKPKIPDLERHSVNSLNKIKIKQIKYSTKPNSMTFKVLSNKKYNNVEFPVVFYPGFKVSNNKKTQNFCISKNHLIKTSLKKGTNNITIYYRKQLINYITFIISIITTILLLLYINKENKK
ncbi:hypothetical protein ACQW5G_07135 [Fructilactobacillus sp. Tb1]|uniref:hypothetical protein n=1 Tax=Fructilactobacillus sp. Tb1 TaxID=3422304 RepID=UPI003D2CDFD3